MSFRRVISGLGQLPRGIDQIRRATPPYRIGLAIESVHHWIIKGHSDTLGIVIVSSEEKLGGLERQKGGKEKREQKLKAVKDQR